ncbi:hypothetical protein SSX86_026819 [Deinandra increscens subsp. villosa]|uniref:C2H2-type domain-containing protein n=1 Tax=Deinandra increscens subsp. villosa TaxID=3103831 RepID=A0AAP0CM38_9ASTR
MDHNLIYYKKDCGFSWPRRNFRCNFCNKEYKSAQALGGHMNVHRKDRVKLGLVSSSPSRHTNANPNPNHILPPSPLRYLPYYNTYHSSLFPLVSNTKDEQLKEGGGGENDGTRVRKKCEILEMEIGSLKDGSVELDLELRLGRS